MNKTACSRKTLLRLALMLLMYVFAGTAAHAEWIQFGRTDDFRIYVDQRLIRKSGDSAQLWQLMDFTVAQWADAKTAVGSIKNLIEYDCTQPRLRPLAAEAFTEQMGEGRVVANERVPDPQWENIEPGSTPEKMRKFACGMKP
jgi:hypothetical protein